MLKAFAEGVTRFTVEKDGKETKELQLNLQLQSDASSRDGAILKVTLSSLRAGVEYKLAVVAHNWYGSTSSNVVVATTKTKACASVECSTPPTCLGGETLTSTTLAGRCCPIVFCICDVGKCPNPSTVTTCTADQALVEVTTAGAAAEQCCPEYACVPWEETCDASGSSCTCPSGRAGQRCELLNPDDLPCGVGCSICNEDGPSVSCSVCTDSMYLLDGFCQESCPPLGYEAAGAWAADGRRCQPQLPCSFVSAGGIREEHLHKATWCDGPESACHCDAGQYSCRVTACANGGAVAGPTPISSSSTSSTTAIAASVSTAAVTVAATTQSVTTFVSMTTTTALLSAKPTEEKTTTTTDGSAPVNGGWSKWSGYTECMVPATADMLCYQERMRTCSNPWPRNNGLPCQGKGSESRACRCPGASTQLPEITIASSTAQTRITTVQQMQTRTLSATLPRSTSSPNVATDPRAISVDGESGASGSNSTGNQEKKRRGGGGIAAAVVIVLLLIVGGVVGWRLYAKRRQDSFELDSYFVGQQQEPSRGVHSLGSASDGAENNNGPKLNADALSPAARVLEDKVALENLQQKSVLATQTATEQEAQAAERRLLAAAKLAPLPARRVVSVQSAQPEITLHLDEVSSSASEPAAQNNVQAEVKLTMPSVRPAGAPAIRQNMWSAEAEC